MLQWLLPREVTCHTAPGCSSLRGLAMHRGYLGKSKAPRIDAPVERIAPEVSIPRCSRTSSSTCSRFEIGEPTPNGGGVTQRDGSPHLAESYGCELVTASTFRRIPSSLARLMALFRKSVEKSA